MPLQHSLGAAVMLPRCNHTVAPRWAWQCGAVDSGALVYYAAARLLHCEQII